VARGRKPGSLHSADSGRMTQREDAPIGMTQKKMTLEPRETRGHLTPNPFPMGPSPQAWTPFPLPPRGRGSFGTQETQRGRGTMALAGGIVLVGMTIRLDAETRNRYRLRSAKLSEILPRSERSLATVRMTEKETWNRYRLRQG
jgi:hypothetical protein